MNTDTLQKARYDLKQGWKTPHGAICSCCGQNVKLYPRSISGHQAKMLCKLYRLCDGNSRYHHRSLITKDNSGDLAKMAFWGLIEEGVNEDVKKKNSGNWRITERGRLFARGEIRIPRTVFIFNKLKREESSNVVSIHDVWKERFDYRELMGYLI